MKLTSGNEDEICVDDLAALLEKVSLPTDVKTLQKFIQADDATSPKFQDWVAQDTKSFLIALKDSADGGSETSIASAAEDKHDNIHRFFWIIKVYCKELQKGMKSFIARRLACMHLTHTMILKFPCYFFTIATNSK